MMRIYNIFADFWISFAFPDTPAETAAFSPSVHNEPCSPRAFVNTINSFWHKSTGENLLQKCSCATYVHKIWRQLVRALKTPTRQLSPPKKTNDGLWPGAPGGTHTRFSRKPGKQLQACPNEGMLSAPQTNVQSGAAVAVATWDLYTLDPDVGVRATILVADTLHQP